MRVPHVRPAAAKAAAHQESAVLRQPASPLAAPALPTSYAGIMSLQRSAGNRAVAQLVQAKRSGEVGAKSRPAVQRDAGGAAGRAVGDREAEGTADQPKAVSGAVVQRDVEGTAGGATDRPEVMRGSIVQRNKEGAAGDAAMRRDADAAARGALVQRDTEGSGPAPAAKPSGGSWIVEDGESAAAGQLPRSEFLAKLREQVTKVADEVLAELGQTSANCPYIPHWFGFYEGKDSKHIEQSIRRYAPEAAGAGDWQTCITIVSQRVKTAFQMNVQSGSLEGVPEELPRDLEQQPATTDREAGAEEAQALPAEAAGLAAMSAAMQENAAPLAQLAAEPLVQRNVSASSAQDMVVQRCHSEAKPEDAVAPKRALPVIVPQGTASLANATRLAGLTDDQAVGELYALESQQFRDMATQDDFRDTIGGCTNITRSLVKFMGITFPNARPEHGPTPKHLNEADFVTPDALADWVKDSGDNVFFKCISRSKSHEWTMMKRGDLYDLYESDDNPETEQERSHAFPTGTQRNAGQTMKGGDLQALRHALTQMAPRIVSGKDLNNYHVSAIPMPMS